MFDNNGLGDRLTQTVGGLTTRYALDLAASLGYGLTQVLGDGTSKYLYGPSTGSGQARRIGQEGFGGRAYFLGDALNSARQLVNDAGQIGLGRAYEPYGDPLSIAGEMQTAYGFAGEWRDATGLVNLRARYYAPTNGRFVQQDPLRGSIEAPGSLNPYVYGLDNPMTVTDPSGKACVLGFDVGWLGGEACSDEDRNEAATLFQTLATHAQFQRGFFLELVNSLAAGIPGFSLRVADQFIDPASELYRLLGLGCESPSLTFYKARVLQEPDPFFQMGRLGGRVTALAIGVGEGIVGLLGSGGSLVLAFPTGGGSIVTLAGSTLLVAHSGAVATGVIVNEMHDPLIARAGVIIAAAAANIPGGASGGENRRLSDREYEEAVRKQSGGTRQVVRGRELDSVTDDALIEAKNNASAVNSPRNFLSQARRQQIQYTIESAKLLGKRAEFWFPQSPHQVVWDFILGEGGIVRVWAP